ncbi:MAG: tripartite tricarboxylate transporter substrate binding protein, partial [Succinivibrio sp.]|nr:tripartite tricarboxylate transporter substrate binding protein [Succinivibrio sp.]
FMDFEPVAVYGKQCGENIVVLASSPYKSMDDLLKAVNRRPNKIKIGVSMGSSSFVSSVILSKAKNAHFKMIDVGGDSQGRLNSLLNKYSDVTIAPYAVIRDELEAGKIRSLATLMSARLPATPNIPTIAEAGIPEITFDTLYLLMAPKGTAPEIIEKLNASIQDVVLHNEDYKAMTTDYNKQEPYALSVKDTLEVLKEQRKHMQTFAQYLN